MKVVAGLCVLLAATAARAGTGVGHLAIFSDAALTDSTLMDTSIRVVDIYVAHMDGIDVWASEFRIEADPGFTGEWIDETSPFWPNLVGTSPEGVYVWYGPCLSTDVVVIRSRYLLWGTSSPCSRLRVVSRPGSYDGRPHCVSCLFIELPCDPEQSLVVNCSVAAENTTWGRLKSLYR